MSRAFRLGLFIVGTLAILVAGVFLIGDKQFLFSSTYALKTTFKNVGGLNNGAEVRVGGVNGVGHGVGLRQTMMESLPGVFGQAVA